jgi:hypothetical protein
LNTKQRLCTALAALVGLFLATAAQAEPYLAVANGFKCGQCHVNPTGGGERTAFGEVFAQTLMPAQHLDTGTDTWTGQLNRFIAIGGDLRFDATVQQVPNTATTDQFNLQQSRIYLSANVIPDRLLVYVDEQLAPGGAFNREAWGMFWSADHSWYVKGGQLYLPFGLRLQDQSAYILTASGINMNTPDNGVEFGWLKGHWDAQLALSNGTAGGPTTGNGKQGSLQVSWVQNIWRLGVAANVNDSSSIGSRTAYALFGGLKTGPIAWLGQAEIIDDQSVTPGGQKQLGGLLEANYAPARGHNIKVTAEYLDPNRDVPNDQQTRWSLVYEYTPIQFLQLRGGFRYNDGISQLPAEHLKLYFVELHGFF